MYIRKFDVFVILVNEIKYNPPNLVGFTMQGCVLEEPIIDILVKCIWPGLQDFKVKIFPLSAV